MTRIGRVTWLALACALGGAVGTGRATAGSWCGPTQPVCGDFWAADAVFVGRVVSSPPARRPQVPPPQESGHPGVEPVQVTSEPFDPLRPVVVELLESFRGVGDARPGARIDVDAAESIRGGNTYMFFAHRRDGRLTVYGCARTRPLFEAAGDLLYARGLATSTEATARVFGAVRWESQAAAGGRLPDAEPLPTATVTITGERIERRLTTDKDGRWETRLPPGTYRAVIQLPAANGGRSDRGEFTISDPRACRELNVEVGWSGGLTGRVTDGSGRPLAGVVVHRTSNRSMAVLFGWVRTGDDGRFRIDDVGRGTHELRIGVELLPPEGTIQLAPRLGPAEHLDLGTLRLPAGGRFTTIRGVVRDRTGAPVAGVRLQIAEVGRAPEFAPAFTDARGRYVFAAVPGRRYVVSLDSLAGEHVSDVEPEPIQAGAVSGPRPIVLRPRR